ncbi:IS3 family transposase [Thomasclavelia spiroformis]
MVWYNTKRIKKSLNYLSPKEYRQLLDLEIKRSKKLSAPPPVNYFV